MLVARRNEKHVRRPLNKELNQAGFSYTCDAATSLPVLVTLLCHHSYGGLGSGDSARGCDTLLWTPPCVHEGSTPSAIPFRAAAHLSLK